MEIIDVNTSLTSNLLHGDLRGNYAHTAYVEQYELTRTADLLHCAIFNYRIS